MPLVQKAMPTQAVMAATSTRKALGVRNVRMTMAGNVPIARDSIAATVRNVHIAATAPTARASILTRKVAKASKGAIVRVLIPVGRGTASNVVTVRASIPTKKVARATSNALTVRASTPTRRVAKASNAPIARASIPIRQQRGYRPRFNPNQEGGEGQQRSFRPRFNPNNGGRRPGYAGGGNNGGYGQQQRPYRQRTADYNPNAKYSKKKQIEYKEQFVDPNEPIRLNKFLANAGICSRREADEFIQAGVVSVNGQVVTELGTKIKRSDEVKFHDQPVSIERKIYILLNKPKDTVTTSDDPQARRTVMDLVKNACPERIYPVGRLDRNTTGVLLLTNDGDLASKLTHPKYLKKKIYHVHLDKDLTRADMDQIVQGIQLDDGEIHADAISYTSEEKKNDVGIEIHSGRNRIVRRIFESLGYKVVKLDRVYFAGLTKKGLRRGEWRFLTEAEVNYLRMGAFE